MNSLARSSLALLDRARLYQRLFQILQQIIIVLDINAQARPLAFRVPSLILPWLILQGILIKLFTLSKLTLIAHSLLAWVVGEVDDFTCASSASIKPIDS